jgi:hypothetical protein
MFLIIEKSSPDSYREGNLFMIENFFVYKILTNVEEMIVTGKQFPHFKIPKSQNS